MLSHCCEPLWVFLKFRTNFLRSFLGLVCLTVLKLAFYNAMASLLNKNYSLVTPLGVTTYFRITITHVATPEDVTKLEFFQQTGIVFTSLHFLHNL